MVVAAAVVVVLVVVAVLVEVVIALVLVLVLVLKNCMHLITLFITATALLVQLTSNWTAQEDVILYRSRKPTILLQI